MPGAEPRFCCIPSFFASPGHDEPAPFDARTLFARPFPCRHRTTIHTTGPQLAAWRKLKNWFLLLGLATAASGLLAGAVSARAPVAGIVWQLSETAPDATGNWHRLGARELLVQWTVVNGVAYVPGTGLQEAPRMPDWKRIGREPWAERVIVGLSGRSDEQAARRSIDAMVAESLRISRGAFPFRVSGWYFPAEVDPTWREAPALLPPALKQLPRPLWVSVYDSSNMGPGNFADWLATWLPRDVGVLFQDGVGIHVRTAPVAREYADALAERLGKARVRVIAEAFRSESGRFRPATAAELREQFAAYKSFPVYLFDGPHYVSERLVEDVLAP
jgi:hypothetical protein